MMAGHLQELTEISVILNLETGIQSVAGVF
jgi:hypothetical protein